MFFTEDDYAETEGVGTFLPVMIAKDRPIANPLELSVTPLVIGAPELLGLIPEGTIPPDNPLSPNRAGITYSSLTDCSLVALYLCP